MLFIGILRSGLENEYYFMSALPYIVEVILFLAAVFACLYLPGKYLLRVCKIEYSLLEALWFPIVFGITIFTTIAYFLSWVNLWILIIPIILFIDYLSIGKGRVFPKKIDQFHAWPLIIVVFCALLFSLSIVVKGIFFNSIGPVRDDFWHLALIQELIVHFPPDNPGFAGIPLRGYHFFFNFFVAQVSKLFFISPVSLYFHFFPVLFAFLWGASVYSLVYRWRKDINASLWAVFLTMAGGSFGFVLLLQGHTGFSIDDVFGMTQPFSALVNPPFTISILFIVTSLFCMYQYFATRKKMWLIPLALIAGILPMFKVYGGILLVAGLMILVLFEAIRKNYIPLFSMLFAALLFLSTYWVFVGRSGSFIWAPLWAPHKVLVDNLPWYGYAEKQYTYSRLGVMRGVIEIEVYALFIFIIGSLGTRVLGLLANLTNFVVKRQKPSAFTVTLFFMTLVSLAIPLFFIQSIKVFEIIQLTWYFLFFTSLFAALGFSQIFRLRVPKIVKIFAFIAVIVVTLPSAYEKMVGYFIIPRFSMDSDYFEGMKLLRSEGKYEDTILELPDKKYRDSKDSIKQWYGRSTPSIVAFSNKRSYFNSEYIDFTNLPVDSRILDLERLVLFDKESTESNLYNYHKKEIENFFEQNSITYIYSPDDLGTLKTINGIKEIYGKESIYIYKIE